MLHYTFQILKPSDSTHTHTCACNTHHITYIELVYVYALVFLKKLLHLLVTFLLEVGLSNLTR